MVLQNIIAGIRKINLQKTLKRNRPASGWCGVILQREEHFFKKGEEWSVKSDSATMSRWMENRKKKYFFDLTKKLCVAFKRTVSAE